MVGILKALRYKEFYLEYTVWYNLIQYISGGLLEKNRAIGE